MQNKSVELFQKNWAIYQKIIQHNYMFHQELGAYTKHVWQQQFKETPIHLLDLGCGDAFQISSIMKSCPSASYTGFDLSETVLNFASQNLESTQTPFVLKAGAMETLIEESKHTYNLIYSSFAIHHLQDEQKITLLQTCHEKLNKDGMMILIDVFRLEDETRSSYLQAYNHMFRQWENLDEEEKDLIAAHLNAYDFPTTIATIEIASHDIGFDVEIMPSFDRYHHMLVLRKN